MEAKTAAMMIAEVEATRAEPPMVLAYGILTEKTVFSPTPLWPLKVVKVLEVSRNWAAPPQLVPPSEIR